MSYNAGILVILINYVFLHLFLIYFSNFDSLIFSKNLMLSFISLNIVNYVD